MKTMIKTITTTVCAAAVAFLVSELPASPVKSVAFAQKATTLDQLLNQVRQGASRDQAENQRRINEFRQARDRQASLVNQAKAEVAAQEKISEQLEKQYNDNETDLNQLNLQLADRVGVFGELFGVARQVSGDTRGQLEQSLISAEFPGRAEKLNEIAQNKDLPTMDQLRYLWYTLQQEMTEQGKVVRFKADVVASNGVAKEEDVTRLGPFVAIANGKYVVYDTNADTETGELRDLARQPQSEFVNAAKRIEKAKGDGYVRAAIDPSLGTILGLQVQTPDLLERISQGRQIGYITIALGALGVVIGFFRLFALWGTNGAVKSAARRQRASKGNPLGRIFLAYEENANIDTEALELKLDDAILKEVPKLESGLNVIKVLAAVAPMLGLLGTVTGMIQTFQSITLFGTGDPKVMAGGISQALVTTVIGLVCAIPLLLLHSFASGQAREIQNVLEEQAAGLVARRAEGSA